MESHLGTNYIPMLVLLPIWLIVVVATIRVIVKKHTSLWRRIVVSIGGLFMLFGFAIILVGFYYHLSPTFASTFRFYAYTALAPKDDPFQVSEGDYRPILMLRDVTKKNGEVSLLYHPNPDYPTLVSIFTQGKFIEANLYNDILSIPNTEAGSLPRVTKTSLWWALTKDLGSQISTAD